MGRLIDEDDVMRMLTGVELNNGTITDAKTELRNVKTAYDVDRTVAELEEWTFEADIIMPFNKKIVKNNKVIMSSYAIETVRKGGV